MRTVDDMLEFYRVVFVATNWCAKSGQILRCVIHEHRTTLGSSPFQSNQSISAAARQGLKLQSKRRPKLLTTSVSLSVKSEDQRKGRVLLLRAKRKQRLKLNPHRASVTIRRAVGQHRTPSLLLPRILQNEVSKGHASSTAVLNMPWLLT